MQTLVERGHVDDDAGVNGGLGMPGLNGFLWHHAPRLTGVLYGVDTEVWNPARDPYLAARYDADDLAGSCLDAFRVSDTSGVSRALTLHRASPRVGSGLGPVCRVLERQHVERVPRTVQHCGAITGQPTQRATVLVRESGLGTRSRIR